MARQPGKNAPRHPDGPSKASAADDPQFVLEVVRGRTEFPSRPVPQGRFLIGSGPHCDLRLGGEGMPAVHSIVVADGAQPWIEAVAERVPLQVNGQTVRESRLCDSDVVTLGPFAFIVRRATQGEEPGSSHAETPQHIPELTGNPAADRDELADLSAEELVDLIEREQQQVDDFDGGQAAGAEALWQAVQARAAQQEAAPAASSHRPSEPDEPSPADRRRESPEGELVRHLDQAVSQLQTLAAELEQRSREVSGREADPTVAAELLEFQQRLAEQLKALQQHIESIQGEESRSLRPAA